MVKCIKTYQLAFEGNVFEFDSAEDRETFRIAHNLPEVKETIKIWDIHAPDGKIYYFDTEDERNYVLDRWFS